MDADKIIKKELFQLRITLITKKDNDDNIVQALNHCLQHINNPSDESLKWILYYLNKELKP